MREVKNYELILSGENDERLLLTFDWDDVPNLPESVSTVVLNGEQKTIHVIFEDGEHWEEVMFVNLPQTLYDIMKDYELISIIGLTDEIKMHSEVKITIA